MKKKFENKIRILSAALIGVALLCSASLALAANSFSFVPSTGTGSTLVSVACTTDNAAYYFLLFAPDGTNLGDNADCATWLGGGTDTFTNQTSGTTLGNYKTVVVDSNVGACTGLDYTACLAAPEFVADLGNTYNFTAGNNTATTLGGLGGATAVRLGSIITDNIIKVILILGCLIGLGILIWEFKRFVGRK